jgi:hypothetical protein
MLRMVSLAALRTPAYKFQSVSSKKFPVALRLVVVRPTAFCPQNADPLAFAFNPDLELDLHILEAVYALVRSNPRRDYLHNNAHLELFAWLRAGAEAYRSDFLEGFSLDDVPDFAWNLSTTVSAGFSWKAAR